MLVDVQYNPDAPVWNLLTLPECMYFEIRGKVALD